MLVRVDLALAQCLEGLVSKPDCPPKPRTIRLLAECLAQPCATVASDTDWIKFNRTSYVWQPSSILQQFPIAPNVGADH